MSDYQQELFLAWRDVVASEPEQAAFDAVFKHLTDADPNESRERDKWLRQIRAEGAALQMDYWNWRQRHPLVEGEDPFVEFFASRLRS